MNGRDPLIVVDIVVPEAELVRRLSTRMVCDVRSHTAGASTPAGTRRDGASAGRVRAVRRHGWCSAPTTTTRSCCERLKVYQRADQPLVEYYRARPTFRSVNGAQPPDRVAADLAAAIEAARQRRGRARERDR